VIANYQQWRATKNRCHQVINLPRANLFTTIATLGTPLDVTLQELRVEMLFPADDATKRVPERRARGARLR
jgi:hypothetical protein